MFKENLIQFSISFLFWGPKDQQTKFSEDLIKFLFSIYFWGPKDQQTQLREDLIELLKERQSLTN
jgi:hypothetical protein